ncbi:MAG TPA: hypothetical protein VL501_05875 [Pyrinomonadaceae bacterium]|jgi:hypothetical protein|nr:hypothetical protein [Pyrinomonadaceae bacterium]
MRSVQVNTPKDRAKAIAELAFETGVSVVNVQDAIAWHKDGERDEKVTVGFETSTPKAKKFVDDLLVSDAYDRQVVWFEVRERRSIITTDPIHDVTYPWVIPSTDILQDLYQFSHITLGLIGRVLLAACLLAYGLLHQNLLLMIAGMMFIPMLPVLSAIGFGAWVGHWRLSVRALAVLGITLSLLFIGGLLIAAVESPPVRYDEFPSVVASALISIAVGVAAALANTDDVGRRELIGLAATSQIAIVPAWMGLCAILGVPTSDGSGGVQKHLLSLVINVLCVVIASLITYVAIRAPHPSLRVLNDEK